ncbi:hypothetical protein Tco_1312393 [Tanacetum coccineum]
MVTHTIDTVASVLTQRELDHFCNTYNIPADLRPELPGREDTIKDAPAGKIGIYTRFLEFANIRVPLSRFLLRVLEYYQVNFSQLSVLGAAKVTEHLMAQSGTDLKMAKLPSAIPSVCSTNDGACGLRLLSETSGHKFGSKLLPNVHYCLKGYPLAGQHTTLQSVGNSLTSNVKDNGISMSTGKRKERQKEGERKGTKKGREKGKVQRIKKEKGKEKKGKIRRRKRGNERIKERQEVTSKEEGKEEKSIREKKEKDAEGENRKDRGRREQLGTKRRVKEGGKGGELKKGKEEIKERKKKNKLKRKGEGKDFQEGELKGGRKRKDAFKKDGNLRKKEEKSKKRDEREEKGF